MEEKLVLTMDCGTRGIRGIIFDAEGKALARAEVMHEGYYSKEPGYMEAPGSMFWDDFCEVTKCLKREEPSFFCRLSAITLAAQRDIMTILDEQGEPLRDFISWMDERTIKKPLPVKMPYQLAFTLLGKKNFTETFNRGTHGHWIKINEPALWQKAQSYVLLSTYLIAKLTGKVQDCRSNIAGHLPFDFKKKKWCGPYAIKRQIIQIEREKLCDLSDSCAIIGAVTKEAAQATGLPMGLPFIGSGTDKGCETIGVGCTDNHSASVSLGTQATVETLAKKYYELVPFYPPFPAVDPGGYNPEITIYRGFWMVNWFVDFFAEKERENCLKMGINIYDFLNEKLETVPAGSGGLMLQPYWGHESFKEEAMGSIIGLNDGQNKYYIYRSLIEGLGFALREGLEMIEKKSGIAIEKVGLSGGGSSSSSICQIMADIFGRETYCVQTTDTTGLGGAMACYVGLGRYPDLEAAGKQMIRKTRVFNPDEENAKTYEVLYKKVYRQAYKRYKPLYRVLHKLNK